MILSKVIGTLVATQKNQTLREYKLLIVQPIDLTGAFIGRDLIAIDHVDAGIGDTVLVMQEGTGARQILKREDIPVHSVIVAVVDGMDIPAA
ncbi:MAG: EutN/CcmL family microcompartment protein [Ignavibacteriales bacterium]|nr:EutN/CcmL family microcompartment protein [Ignavibacteriales bacterium]